VASSSGRSAGIEQARRLFNEAGLLAPPVPDSLAGTFQERGPWTFASRDLGRHSLYAFRRFVNEGLNANCPEYIAVGHAGHGINSYAMHYFLVYGPVALFLQIPYGGAYMDPAEAVADVNERFGQCARLIEVIDPRRVDPSARHRRLFVVDIGFLGIRGIRRIDLPYQGDVLDSLIPPTSRDEERASPILSALHELEGDTNCDDL